MAKIKPFKGIIYNTKKEIDISSKIAPPYDVIDSKLQTDLYIKDPDNIIRIILGKKENSDIDNDLYKRSAGYYNNWVNNAIMSTDDCDAFYVWDQTFISNNQTYLRRALISKVRCLPFDKKEVIPHEKTHKGPKEDRLRLFNEVGTQFSQIFSLYSDSNNQIKNILESNIDNPILEANYENVNNKLYRITSKTVINSLIKEFENINLYIADGHHRYETSVKFFEDKKVDGSTLMSLVQIDDPGLIVLPTHRAIKSKLSNFICLQKLEKQFFIDKKSFSEWPNIVKKINSYNDNHIFGFANRKLGISGILRPIETLKFNDCWSEYSDQWKALDVSALHAFILNSIFDFNINSLFDKENIFYSHREKECIKKLDEDYNWVFFLRPTSIEQLIEIADNDEVMPPKSTFFYPKFLSGFINSEL